MRKIFAIGFISLILCSQYSKAQDFPYHYFSHTVPMLNNPSFAAMKNKISFDASTYNIWAAGYKPINDFVLSFSMAPDFKKSKKGRWKDSKVGLGANFINESIGPLKQNILHLNYAYHIPINRSTHLSFGVSGIFNNLEIDVNSLTELEHNDPRLEMGNDHSFLFDGGFGASIYSDHYVISFSALNLASNGFMLKNGFLNEIPNYRKYNLSGQYFFEINKHLKIAPLFTLRNSLQENINFDSMMEVIVKNISLGVGYRSEKSFFAFTKIPFNNFVFSYTSENPIMAKRMFGNGHSFSIGWYLQQ